MMDNEQYLLLKLAEECTEVAQMAAKTMQFGAYEKLPGQPLTNNQRLHGELNDLMASIRMLNYECGFGYQPDEEAIQTKIDKVKKYREYSRQIGTVK